MQWKKNFTQYYLSRVFKEKNNLIPIKMKDAKLLSKIYKNMIGKLEKDISELKDILNE